MVVGVRMKFEAILSDQYGGTGYTAVGKQATTAQKGDIGIEEKGKWGYDQLYISSVGSGTSQ